MNKVILIGRLTRDPELKYTAGSGVAVATFTLAVDRNYVGQNGQREADFINIVVWRKLAESVANNLSKGRMVAISGSLQSRKYQAQDGSNRYVTEVTADEVKYLDWGNKGQQQGQQHQEEGTDDFMPIEDGEEFPW